MSDLNQDEVQLTKEEKLKKLQELGAVGTDEGSATILNLSHVELDYLLKFHSEKEQVQNASPSDALKEKYDAEVIRRRTAESDLKVFKQKIVSHAQTLVEAAKEEKK